MMNKLIQGTTENHYKLTILAILGGILVDPGWGILGVAQPLGPWQYSMFPQPELASLERTVQVKTHAWRIHAQILSQKG